MKKILTIAMACAGLMSFTACNDFLDESPKSSLTNVDYYQTEAQAT
ncbi:secreted protein, partial [gut metagenome]